MKTQQSSVRPIVAVPSKHVMSVAEQCGRKGVHALIVLTAGFAEVGPEGQQRQLELLRICHSYGMRLIGPNCIGAINTDPEAPLNATFGPLMPAPGRIGMATQSGALGLAAIDFTAARDLGFSSLVSMGNKADISGNDLLGYWLRILGPTSSCCTWSRSVTRASSRILPARSAAPNQLLL